MPLTPEVGVYGVLPVALDGLDHLALEGLPAHLNEKNPCGNIHPKCDPRAPAVRFTAEAGATEVNA